MPPLGNQTSRLNFGPAIQQWMRAMGFTAAQAARKTGISRKHFEELLSDQRKPSLAIVEKFFAVSGIDIYHLAELNDDASRLPKPIQRLRRELREEWAKQITNMTIDRGLIPSGQW